MNAFWLLLLTIILNIQMAIAQTEQHSESGGGLAAGFGVFFAVVFIIIMCCGKAAE